MSDYFQNAVWTGSDCGVPLSRESNDRIGSRSHNYFEVDQAFLHV